MGTPMTRGRVSGSTAEIMAKRLDAVEEKIKMEEDPPDPQIVREKVRDFVNKCMEKSTYIPLHNGKTLDVHSVDDSYVYAFPERRGNGDKSRCNKIHLEEFAKLVDLN